MRAFLLGVLILAPSLAWAAACPIGSLPSVDNFGNQICKSINTGATDSMKGSVDRCPLGTQPDFDAFGTRVCKKFDTGEKFYDTSRGCPMGTLPAVDMYGKKVCQKF